MTTHYSPNFTRRELLFSTTATREGIDNTPTTPVENNLRLLCVVLEAIRAQFGPWKVTSGYRCKALNDLTPGSSRRSAHIDGRAADGEPVRQEMTLVEVMDWLAGPGRMEALGIDQAILEYPPGGWIHIGIAKAGRIPRHQMLVKFEKDKPALPFHVWRASQNTVRASRPDHRPEGAKE